MRVLICDRIPVVRDGLQTLLEAEPDISVVGSTDSGIHAIMLVRTQQPDVVLTGLDLGGISGLEMIHRLVREAPESHPRIVVFTMTDSDDLVAEVLRANVNGLLAQEASREEIAFAVRAAAQGQTVLASSVTQRLLDWFRTAGVGPEDGLQPMLTGLTPREREVLLLMAQGMSAEEIAIELFIGMTTVRTHLYRLRCKLNMRDRAQLVSFAYRAGLMRPA